MADKNIDDNMFDEKIIAKRIADEQDHLTRLQMDLSERQDRKKKVTANIRSLTHKIKALEEEITKDALDAEALKRKKEKYVTKVDTKQVNKQIDKKCEDVFGGLLQDINPTEMKIEVQFEDLKTIFTISDQRINNHYDNRETEDDSAFRGSAREGSMLQGSILSSDTNVGARNKKNFLCRTFGQMKQDVAAFFSLSADNFFFSDNQNSVFLDDLPIRPTLFPFGQKITLTQPRLNIILTNNAKYDDMIMERIKEQIGEPEVVDDTQQKADQKEAYDNEQARKKADQKRKSAEEYYQFKKRVYKFKGLFSSLLYVVLIVLWLYNILSNFEFDETYMMRSATETVFGTFNNAPNTATFYELLINQITNTTYSEVPYGFVHFNYYMPGAEVVCKQYKQTDCAFKNAYMDKYYPPVKGTCTEPREDSKEPFEANGVTYYYDDDPDKKVSLPTRKGSFDNRGFRLPVNYSDPDMRTKIANFVDAFVAEFVSFNFIIYNPGLEKMACVFRMVYRYNRDKTSTDIFSYVFNVRKQTEASLVIQELVLVIASILVLNSIFDMLDFVPAAKVELDLDLVWIRKAKKGHIKEEEASRHKPNFKMVTIGGTVLKISFPSFVNLLNLLSVVLNVWVVALDLNKHATFDKIDWTTGAGVNCPSFIGRKSTTEILYVIIIMLMMIVLLRYISQYIKFIQNFFVIIQRLVRNTFSLGILIFWLFMTLSLFGVYTFGSFFPEFESFGYMYGSIVLLLMKKNIILDDAEDFAYYNLMSTNIGTGALIGLMIFLYVVINLIIIKTITSIVIRSIKEAEGNQRSEEDEEEKRKEESLTLIREKFYEEFRLSQSKARVKSQGEAAKQAEAKERNTKKKR